LIRVVVFTKDPNAQQELEVPVKERSPDKIVPGAL
jgi:hypothetical protein